MNVSLYPLYRVESHIHALHHRVLGQSLVGAQHAEGVDGEEAAPVESGGR